MSEFTRSKKGKILIVSILLAVIAAVLIIFFLPKGEKGYRSIRISELSGTVMTENDSGRFAAYENMYLGDGIILSTDSDSYTRMVLDSDKYVKLEQLSQAQFVELGSDKERNTVIRLDKGALTNELVAPLGANERYVVNTPNAVMSVRGTYFRVEVRYDENGDAYTDIYTYGGTVACRRIMPDGTIVDEEVLIKEGYKACVKMDEIITIYVEELIEEEEDKVDPIEIAEVSDADVVDIYNASMNGHKMFMESEELYEEIDRRDIDLDKYHSAYDKGKIPHFNKDDKDDNHGRHDKNDDNDKAHSDRKPEESSVEESVVSENDETVTETDLLEADDNVTDDNESHNYTASAETAVTAPVKSDNGQPAVTTAPDNNEAYAEGTTVPDISYSESDENVTADSSETSESESEASETVSATKSETITELIPESETRTESITGTTAPIHTGTGMPIWTTVPTESETGTTTDTTAPIETETSTTAPTESETDTATETTVPTESETDTATGTTAPAESETDTTTDTTAPTESETDESETTETTTETTEEEPEGIAVDSTNFPDSVFMNYVSTNFDTDSDGNLSDEEIAAVTRIDVSGTDSADGGVTSLAGVENFTALTNLYCSYNSGLTELDVSNNIKLEYLWCQNTGLTNLDVSKNTALTRLSCSNITSLDVSNNTALILLFLDNTGITNLDVSKNTALRDLWCSKSALSHIDLTNNTNLVSLYTSGNKYPIPSNATTFDTTTIEGFDPSKVSNVVNADFDPATGIFSNITGDVSYTYACNATYSETFTLARTGEAIEGVAIGSTNFPDSVFMNYVSTNFDTDSDGYLSDEEIAAVKKIDVRGTDSADGGVTSLAGVECFTELTYLDCGYNAGLTEFDVSNNTKLEYLWCENTGITNLDVSKNTALTILNCPYTGITSLDVSDNTALTGLDCSNTGLTSLDVSNNTALTGLYCSNTRITSLDVSSNTALMKLYCSDTGITSLDISNNTALTSLNCENCCMPYFLITADNSNLTIINASGNKYPIPSNATTFDTATISGFDPTRVSNVENASFDRSTGIFTNITGDVSYTYACGSVTYSTVFTLARTGEAVDYGVAVDSTNFPDSVFMNYVSTNFDDDSDGYLSDEEIAAVKKIDVRGTSSADGGVTSLVGVENFTALTYLYCSYNSGLTELDVSNNTKLEYLWCENTGLTSLDVSNNTALKTLICNNTGITSLDVSNNTALKGLHCNDTGITSLDVSQNTALDGLNCSGTEITSLDVSNNTALMELYCYNTGLTSLDVSNNTVISVLYCYNTEITSLDVSKNTVLESLYCYNTEITSLDVSNTNLVTLNCEFCLLPYIDLSNIYDTYILNLYATGNTYPIPSNATTFDTSTIEGFDPSKVSNITNATFNSTTGVFSNITGDVSYTYACSDNLSETFTLARIGEAVEEVFDGTLYTEDGNITITETGVKQGSATEETSWTGDYVITQRDSSTAVDCAISFESGTHNVTLEGVNTVVTGKSGCYVGDQATVTVNDAKNRNTISVDDDGNSSIYNALKNEGTLIFKNGSISFTSNDTQGSGIYNYNTIKLYSGVITSTGVMGLSMDMMSKNNLYVYGGELHTIATDHNGIISYGGNIYIYAGIVTSSGEYGLAACNDSQVTISGGSVLFNGTDYDLYTENKALLITGGSVCLNNSTVNGSITNNDQSLECVVYDTFPTEAERTFTNSDGTTYVYALTEADKADDGKYYVWKPVAQGVAVDSTNFPDSVFMNYVSSNFDTDSDGYLSDTEIAAVTSIDVGGTSVSDDGNIDSLQGIEHFSELTALWCGYNSRLSELNVSNNSKLQDLRCYYTNLVNLDVSHNQSLSILRFHNTGITNIDLSNNTALTSLSCFETNLQSIDVSNNTQLTNLYCYATKVMYIDVSRNTLLTEFWCSDNTMAYVDLTNNPNLTSFIATGNVYSIPSNATEFDTSTITGFDPSKVSNITNATFNSTTGVFSNITGDVTYTYDCGQGYDVTFTLARTA